MNILQAKQEIKNTIQAYLMKDEFGNYKIPAIRQRPLLMMGPPGIDKTAIMSQIARECGVGLVSYTITHHTRQSAIGLPPEYNKSVRDFDIVTLDRVKRIDIKEDFNVWKAYGYSQNIHGAVMTYLDIKKENFYRIEMTVDGKRFVTARGWEDLSEMIKAYESLDIPINKMLRRCLTVR